MSAHFYEFCVAFRTFDLDLALSLWNTYLLSTARTAVDVMGLSLLHQILFFIEAKTELRLVYTSEDGRIRIYET